MFVRLSLNIGGPATTSKDEVVGSGTWCTAIKHQIFMVKHVAWGKPEVARWTSKVVFNILFTNCNNVPT
jgi:hypothetical protein